MLETYSANFELDAAQGDEIEVKTNIECQGVMSSKIDFLSEFEVYPNPTTNSFTIKSYGTNWKNLNIYNTLGVKVYSNNTVQNSVIINAKEQKMTNGMYFIVVQDQKGNQFTQKLIVD